jgi:thioredoxin reductase (NADPH)
MADPQSDLLVIGAGVAGLAAATRAAERGLATICAEEQMFGGLVLNVAELDPAPAGRSTQGAELSAGLMEEAGAAGVLHCADAVLGIEPAGPAFCVRTCSDILTVRTIVIASGARLKTLGVPGEQEFEHRGVAHCADCDAMFYAGGDVVVVGGGDSALQEALVLARHCRTVFIVHRRDRFRARPHFVEAIARLGNVRPVLTSTVREIRGASGVESVLVERASGATEEIACTGVFPYVGLHPNTAFLPGGVDRDDRGFLRADARLETSLKGIYAIGAVRAGFGGLLDDALFDAARVIDSVNASNMAG